MGDTGCLPSSTLSLTLSFSGKGRALVTTGEGRKQGDLSHQCGASGGGEASRCGRLLSQKVSRQGLGEGRRMPGSGGRSAVSGVSCGIGGKRGDRAGCQLEEPNLSGSRLGTVGEGIERFWKHVGVPWRGQRAGVWSAGRGGSARADESEGRGGGPGLGTLTTSSMGSRALFR